MKSFTGWQMLFLLCSQQYYVTEELKIGMFLCSIEVINWYLLWFVVV